MKRLHLIGRHNHGKTTLAVELITHWRAIGLRVATIKHTPHAYELDTPGKDSWRHREAGAVPAVVVAGHHVAVHFDFPAGTDYADLVAPLLSNVDLLLVEGDPGAPWPKLEVWRKTVGQEPLALTKPGVRLFISDDEPPLGTDIPQMARANVAGIAKFGWEVAEEWVPRTLFAGNPDSRAIIPSPGSVAP